MFGKKKSEKSPAKPAVYPQQTASYPTQPQVNQAGLPTQPPPYGYPTAPPPAMAPPPYSAQPQPAPPAGYGYGPTPHMGQVQYGPQAYYGPPMPPVTGPIQPPTTYIVPGGFDAGARFNGISQPNIPPPPPGCAPNVAQVAAAQGQNVIVTQRPSDWLEGGSSGGYTFF